MADFISKGRRLRVSVENIDLKRFVVHMWYIPYDAAKTVPYDARTAWSRAHSLARMFDLTQTPEGTKHEISDMEWYLHNYGEGWECLTASSGQ